MTIDTLTKGVQAHFEDETSAFKTRITNTIPIGIELFSSENQWEYLDIYFETVAEIEAVSGKTRIKMPAPGTWYKPVMMWTANNSEISYIDRKEWAQRQRINSAAQSPMAFTQIGKDLFLDRPSTGATIYTIYTQTNKNIDLPGLPFEYHGAVMLAVIWFLTPGMVLEGTRRIENPAKRIAWAGYQERVRLAASQELSHKGRTRYLRVDPVAQRRNNYR